MKEFIEKNFAYVAGVAILLLYLFPAGPAGPVVVPVKTVADELVVEETVEEDPIGFSPVEEVEIDEPEVNDQVEPAPAPHQNYTPQKTHRRWGWRLRKR